MKTRIYAAPAVKGLSICMSCSAQSVTITNPHVIVFVYSGCGRVFYSWCGRPRGGWSLLVQVSMQFIKQHCNLHSKHETSTQCWSNVGRWPNIGSILGRCLVFAGLLSICIFRLATMISRVKGDQRQTRYSGIMSRYPMKGD